MRSGLLRTPAPRLNAGERHPQSRRAREKARQLVPDVPLHTVTALPAQRRAPRFKEGHVSLYNNCIKSFIPRMEMSLAFSLAYVVVVDSRDGDLRDGYLIA